MDLSRATWHKSSLSGANGCVEVAFVEGRAAIRDSKDRGGAVLLFTVQEWRNFLMEVRNQEFEIP